MSERATIHQSQQVGVEATPGTAVAADKRLSSVSLSLSPNVEIQTYKPAGSKHATKTVAAKEQANVNVEGVPTYDELTYLLAMAFGNHAVVDNSDGSYTHTFTSRSRGADDLLTLTVEQGDPRSRAHRSAGVSLADLTLEWNRGGNTQSVSGSGFGRAIVDGIQMSGNQVDTVTISGSPTSGTWTLTVGGQTTSALAINASAAAVQAALEALPTVGAGNVVVTGSTGGPYTVEFVKDLAQTKVVVTAANTFDVGSVAATEVVEGGEPEVLDGPVIAANQITVYADADAADIGTTPLGRVFRAALSYTGRQAPVYTLNAAEPSYATQVETDPTLQLELTVEADAAGMALLEAARAQEKRYVRIEAAGPDIDGTSVPHSLVVDLVTRVSAVGEFADEQGVYAIQFTFAAMAGDPDLPANTVELTNGIDTL